MSRIAMTALRSPGLIGLTDWYFNNSIDCRAVASHAQSSTKWSVYLLFIATVSLLDTYLAVINDQIKHDEQNPICLALILMEPVHFTWFILGKLIGNIVVLGTLFWMLRCNYRFSRQIVFAIVGFQILLLCYLYSGHIHDYSMHGIACLTEPSF